jgi:hypothetical protein
MARIPTPALRGQEVGSVQSQFTPTPFQNLNPDADVFGAGQARAMKQASAGLDALSTGITKQAEEDDTLTLLTTQEQSGAFEIEVVNETLNLKQGNAIGASEAAMKRFAAYEASIKPASTQAGRLAQQRHLLQLKSSIASRSASHESTEVFKFKAGKVAGAIGTAQNRAGLNWNNPDIIKQSIEVVTAQTGNLADMNGVTDPEARSLAIKAEVSKTYMSALRGAVAAEDSVEAKKLLDTATEKDGLTAEDKEAALKLVQGATAATRGQALAEEAQVKFPNSLTEQLAFVRNNYSGAEEDEAVKRLKLRDAEGVAAKKKNMTDRFNTAYAKAKRGEKLTPADLEGIDNARQLELLDRVQYKAEPDPNAYNKFVSASGKDALYLTTLTFEELQAEYETKVSPEQWDEISGQWLRDNKANSAAVTSAAVKVSDAAKTSSIIGSDISLLTQAFESTTKTKVEVSDGTPFFEWKTEFNSRLKIATEAAGRELSPLERADIIKRMTLSKVSIDRANWFGQTDATAFRLDAGEIKRLASNLKVNEAQFERVYPVILNSLITQKTPATNESISAVYKTMATAVTKIPNKKEQAAFLANYNAMTLRLIRTNSLLSSDNYIKVWNSRRPGR